MNIPQFWHRVICAGPGSLGAALDAPRGVGDKRRRTKRSARYASKQ